MGDVFVCKLPLENKPGEFVTAYSKWTNSSFSLKVSHGENAWIGDVSSSKLKSLSDFSKYELDEYILETKRALTCDGGSKEFTYSLQDSEFSWKKVIDSVKNVKIKFGFILLEKTMISSVAETIIGTLLDHCISLRKANKTLSKENSDLITANSNLRTHVGKITKLKTEMEETIYAKMLLLLNAKKEKIAELEGRTEKNNPSTGVPSQKNTEMENVEEDTESSTASDLYGSETELDSNESGDEIPAKIKKIDDGQSMTSLANKEESTKEEQVPTASSGSNVCGESHSHPDASEVNIPLLPPRPKKNIKSKFTH